MSIPRSARVAVAAALTLFATGCFKSYVTVSFRPPSLPAGPADVHDGPRMQELRPAVKAVALRAPPACLADAGPVAAGPGLAARSRTILDARCDVLLGELERALAARYRVVPWRELAAAEREAGLAHLAAQRTSADLVLVVSDLAPLPLLVTDLEGAGVVLTNANPDGSPRGKTELSRKSERAIRDLVAERFPDGGLGGVAVQLELLALAAATGEPVWRYHRVLAADLDGARDFKMLLRGRSRTWRPVPPRGRGAAAAEGAEDAIRARIRELARTLARDAVDRFSTAG